MLVLALSVTAILGTEADAEVDGAAADTVPPDTCADAVGPEEACRVGVFALAVSRCSGALSPKMNSLTAFSISSGSLGSLPLWISFFASA